MAALRTAIIGWLAVALVPTAAFSAPKSMTRDEVISIAKTGVGYSYWWGNGCWALDGKNKGSCSGNCPSCSHSGKYGADCSGFTAKAWQVPSNSAVTTCSHPYSTKDFYCYTTHWSHISRGSMKKADALVYRNGCPGKSGHVVVYEKGDPWGKPWVYEARGCSYGIVHNARSFSSSFKARQRNNLVNGCTPATEVCNGKDDDCDGAVDEGGVCAEESEALYMAALMDAGQTTDVNGDGRPDVCARAAAGFRCHLAGNSKFGTQVTGVQAMMPNDQGWSDLTNYATIRMGDINGDGKADVCARGNSSFYCWKSNGTSFAKPQSGPTDLSDAKGWNKPEYYSTIRLADIDGDGKDDLCARYGAGFKCRKSKGSSFGGLVDGPDLGDDNGWDKVDHYGTLRMGDVNGDGKADVCARAWAGVFCWLSNGNGFPTKITGPAWSDGSGFDHISYWSTFRLGDVNGDGKDDACIRTSKDFRCHLSNGTGFGGAKVSSIMPDADGWGDISNYSTIRLADVTGDGKADACVRANAKFVCYKSTGGKFSGQINGPAISDGAGWKDPNTYRTIRLADLNADGKADLCGRSKDGIECWLSNGNGFPTKYDGPNWTDAASWGKEIYYPTIRLAGPDIDPCTLNAEVCNGKDDNCNGQVDEAFPAKGDKCSVGKGECQATGTKVCKADGSGLTCNATAGKPTAELCNGKDDDCDGTIDEDFPNTGKSCSVGKGECKATGKQVCKADGSGLTCSATPGEPVPELCNGKDDDCDGVKDNGELCDDGLPCTTDTCGGGQGCLHEAGGNGCWIDGACLEYGMPDPEEPCRVCAKSSPTGWLALADGTVCPDDGNACTADACLGGVCQHLPTASGQACPDDGHDCTLDICLDGVCGHLVATGCLIKGVCYEEGATAPFAECVLCNPDKPDDWSVAPEGYPCGDVLRCADGILTLPDECNDLAECVNQGTLPCAPYAWCADEETCADSCTQAGDCSEGHYCLEGECVFDDSSGDAGCPTNGDLTVDIVMGPGPDATGWEVVEGADTGAGLAPDTGAETSSGGDLGPGLEPDTGASAEVSGGVDAMGDAAVAEFGAGRKSGGCQTGDQGSPHAWMLLLVLLPALVGGRRRRQGLIQRMRLSTRRSRS